MLNNQKGITLVALVVTIVILIILATISISVAFNGGLINRAESARNHQANADAQYNEIVEYTDSKVNGILGNALAGN